MQPEAQKLQGGIPNAPRKISLQTGFATARSAEESSLPWLAMPERRMEHVDCRKAGVGCKCLGGIEWTVDPDS
jgi:hypothetical protein